MRDNFKEYAESFFKSRPGACVSECSDMESPSIRSRASSKDNKFKVAKPTPTWSKNTSILNEDRPAVKFSN